MMQVSLWREGDETSGVSLVYLGDAIAMEFNHMGKNTPHYFETKAQAVDFIIRSAYGLLSAGYQVYEPEEDSN